MAELTAESRVKYMSLEAVVTRADGTVEDYGVIAEYHKNPLRRLIARIRGMGRIRLSTR